MAELNLHLSVGTARDLHDIAVSLKQLANAVLHNDSRIAHALDCLAVAKRSGVGKFELIRDLEQILGVGL